MQEGQLSDQLLRYKYPQRVRLDQSSVNEIPGFGQDSLHLLHPSILPRKANTLKLRYNAHQLYRD